MYEIIFYISVNFAHAFPVEPWSGASQSCDAPLLAVRELYVAILNEGLLALDRCSSGLAVSLLTPLGDSRCLWRSLRENLGSLISLNTGSTNNVYNRVLATEGVEDMIHNLLCEHGFVGVAMFMLNLWVWKMCT
jgi:hypothetical protein